MRIQPTIRRVWIVCLLSLALLAARSGGAQPQQMAAPPHVAGSPSWPSQASGQPAPLALPERDFPQAYLDLPFHASVSASGGSGVYSIALYDPLPSGLTYQAGPSTLAIGGVPTATGVYRFRIVVTDAGGATVSHDYSVSVLPEIAHPPGSVILSDTEAFTFTDKDNQFFPIKITDNESFNFIDSENEFRPDSLSDTEAFTFGDAVALKVQVGILPATAPSGTYLVAYSQAFSAVGNTGAVTLTPAGTLPTGLTFSSPSSSVTLSGTPSETGTFPLTITAKDSVNTTVVNYILVIAQATQTITVGAVPCPSMEARRSLSRPPQVPVCRSRSPRRAPWQRAAIHSFPLVPVKLPSRPRRPAMLTTLLQA